MAAPTLAPARTSSRHARRRSIRTWGSARWQRFLVAAIAAVCFWPYASPDPGIGIDWSWQAGLALARIHHVAWGPQIVFTYGPLGFLRTLAYYSFEQSLLATIYQPMIVAALLLGIAAALRQRHAPMPSLIGAFVTTGVVVIVNFEGYADLAILAAFAWAAVPLLQHDPRRSTVFTTCLVLGAAAGLQLLVKLNSGLTILVIALAVSVLLDWRAVGRHCATVTAFAASTLIWWVIAGQHLGNLPTWLRYSAAFLSGYSEAMSIPFAKWAYSWVLFWAMVVSGLAWIGALCVMFVRGGPEIPRRFVVLASLLTLITAHAALGRFERGHSFALICLIVVTAVITPLSGIRRRAFVLVVVAGVVLDLGLSTFFDKFPDPRMRAAVQAPRQAVDRLVTLVQPGRLDQRVERTKARQRAQYAIPERFIETIGSGTVHIDSYETSAVWAYDFAWWPVPVFQSYAAYTPALDDLNSESLATGGPEFILSQPRRFGIDRRLLREESPRYVRALLCNYTMSGRENGWTLFTRRDSPRCGPLTPLSEIRIDGNDVAVPAPSGPDMAVLVGIDLEPTVLDRLFQGALAPLSIPTVVLDGVPYRLVPGNAAEPFLVYAHTIGVGRSPSLGQGNVAARLRFYEMQMTP
jgi:hypothetical protein